MVLSIAVTVALATCELVCAQGEVGFAVAADRNPWLTSPAADPRDPATMPFIPDIAPWNGAAERAKNGSANPHQLDGQNVLFLGIEDNNIYAPVEAIVLTPAVQVTLEAFYPESGASGSLVLTSIGDGVTEMEVSCGGLTPFCAYTVWLNDGTLGSFTSGEGGDGYLSTFTDGDVCGELLVDVSDETQAAFGPQITALYAAVPMMTLGLSALPADTAAAQGGASTTSALGEFPLGGWGFQPGNRKDSLLVHDPDMTGGGGVGAGPAAPRPGGR